MAVDQNSLKVMQELQTLATLYGTQFEALRTAIEKLVQTDEERTKLFTDQMEALKVQREAQEALQSNLDTSITSLQEITVALINISDQLQKQIESPSGQA